MRGALSQNIFTTSSITPGSPKLPEDQPPSQRLTIKLKPMVHPATYRQPPRRSVRHLRSSDSQPSGSEYHESEKSMDMDRGHDDRDNLESPQVATTVSSRGRTYPRKMYREPSETDNDDHDQQPTLRRLTRSQGKLNVIQDSDESVRSGSGRLRQDGGAKKPAAKHRITKDTSTRQPTTKPDLPRRLNRRGNREPEQEGEGEGEYIDHPSSGSADEDASFENAPRTSSEPDPDREEDLDADGELDMGVDADAEGELDMGIEADGKPYALRQRQKKVNYVIPPSLEEMKAPPKAKAGGRGSARSGHGSRRGPGWSASGAELGRWMGLPADDSDSDHGIRTPRKPFPVAGGMYGGTVAGGGMMPSDLAAAAGTPSNLGKMGDAGLADADPLGVNTNVTFDEVGGLDDHIHSLKEMTLLPLLYPDVFRRFNVTPPRGVLFHGPPGTGKTLLARALAASCRTNGKQISFFMRKGADCLSKWVGEAERQLRLLFEEAKNCQPSIIFFDEIDGLAPVRSSKQDQIHASIVSTLLALMDGMDGRGQVIVIGATNRPDAIDPALRRPGRFDREFYFPLPGLQAREKILSIMTKGWDGWEGETGLENIKGLAKMTRGYGGADLRALCTEAALNAIQRRYPQIYRSNDRLLLTPETIEVGLRDFMISIKKLIPSSARSSSSSAAPLPPQFVPLLSEALDQARSTIARVLPVEKKRSALEEAEWEDEGGEAGALERELMMQSMETLRVYRPRMMIYGPPGMGQSYIGAAVLHHLEGYHVQSLELGTLFGDSTRTIEAAIVQLFVEAKRHQPSVVYIPSLMHWCAAVSETSRSAVRAMLDTLAPTDPVLLLAIVDGPFSALPRDVRSWFGPSSNNRVELRWPGHQQRASFFEGLIADIQRPPNRFADGIKRKKRVPEELPIAPPLKPRELTAAEIAMQEESDHRIIVLLQYRLGPILSELKRKFKRFTKKIVEEYGTNEPGPAAFQNQADVFTVETHCELNITTTDQEQPAEPLVNGFVTETVSPELPQPEAPTLYDMDLEKMHTELYKGKYLTPHDFLDDIKKIVYNAGVRIGEDAERFYKAQAMLTAAQVSIHEFDHQLRMECDRMAPRERKRREERRKEKGKEKALEESVDGVTYAPRRSARNNGQQPEIAITDPLKLERRLKRQRTGETANDSQVSEEENSETRMTKRSKMIISDDEDPLDNIGPTSQPRPLTVRFAGNAESPTYRHSTPREDNVPLTSMSMVVDQPDLPRPSGFDPFLLNPLPTSSDVFSTARSSPFGDVDGTSNALAASPSLDVFSAAAPVQVVENLTPPASMVISRSHTPVPVAAAAPEPTEVLAPAERPVTPIIAERDPTPFPDFIVDQLRLSELKNRLHDDTADLTVEELEEIRATCLGCVWRHRSDWNRDELLRELERVVDDFLKEIEVDGKSDCGV